MDKKVIEAIIAKKLGTALDDTVKYFRFQLQTVANEAVAEIMQAQENKDDPTRT